MNNSHRMASASLLPKIDPTPVSQQFEAWKQAVLHSTTLTLERTLPASDEIPARLHEAMRYAVLGSGKRMRPLLCHAAGEAAAANPETLNVVGAALEMVHVYSLVHDDLPAMDDDNLRRGRATVHVQYDEATAILVGDALQAQAFMALSQAPVSTACQVSLVRALAMAVSSVGMVGGQMIDLASLDTKLDITQLERMHRMKTGALIQASVRMGALCAETTQLNIDSLDRYSTAIGLAYQVIDDILDATVDTATLGKTAGKDAKDHKPTYVSMLGLTQSRHLAQRLGEQAHQALKNLAGRTDRLHGLADLIINRLH
ncbi:polyprenyl synthetase family protein [Pseudomonas frederiksbergensis]|uniref:polyprenyl synthetase family protein n=1 Tax=Pseudomonas frederiksbergensis TaxID=104087 RepID=UPI003D966773